MLSKAQFEKIALSFDGVEKGTSYGKPAFLLAKKFFTRLRSEDASVVVPLGSFDQRDMLLEVEPAIFHLTSHYKDYPIVLARLAALDTATLKGLLQQHWQRCAPKNRSSQSKADRKTAPAGAKRATAGTRKKKPRTARKTA